MDIDPFWTAAGKAAAARNVIAVSEAIDVIYASTSVQVIVGDTAATVMWLGGFNGRVLVVTAERTFRETSRYGITDVRHATDGEARAWEKRQR